MLANGTAVNASANEHANLWKAQKGGSGNVGFVTRIDHSASLATFDGLMAAANSNSRHPGHPALGWLHPVRPRHTR